MLCSMELWGYFGVVLKIKVDEMGDMAEALIEQMENYPEEQEIIEEWRKEYKKKKREEKRRKKEKKEVKK